MLTGFLAILFMLCIGSFIISTSFFFIKLVIGAVIGIVLIILSPALIVFFIGGGIFLGVISLIFKIIFGAFRIVF